MPPWASAAIGDAPWAAVAIVAIIVGARLLSEVLDIVKIRTMRSANSLMTAYRSNDGEGVWVSPNDGDAQSSEFEPPAKPQLRSVDKPGADGASTASS